MTRTNGKHQGVVFRGLWSIVREASASRKLYNQILGIGFKKRLAVIFIPRLLKGQRLSLCGRTRKQHSPALVRIPGPTHFLRHRLGLSLTLTMSKRRLRTLNRKGIVCS